MVVLLTLDESNFWSVQSHAIYWICPAFEKCRINTWTLQNLQKRKFSGKLFHFLWLIYSEIYAQFDLKCLKISKE